MIHDYLYRENKDSYLRNFLLSRIKNNKKIHKNLETEKLKKE